jgi:mono/diheme cytochrome c family protein
MTNRTRGTVPVFAVAGLIAIALLLVASNASAQGRGGRGGNANVTPLPLGPVTGSAANGRQIYYDQTCYGCHGFNGETGARDLVGTNSPILANEENFINFLRLRADVAPLLPATRMPNYPEVTVSDAAASDLYAFIRSFKLNAPAVEDIPTLQKILESAQRPYQP